MSHSKTDVANLALRAKIIELLTNTNLPYVEIATACKVTWHTVSHICNNFLHEDVKKRRKIAAYSRSKLGDNNPMKGKIGDQHHLFGQRWGKDSKYPTELKPTWFEGRENSKRAYEAHVLLCKELEITKLPEDYIVHHIDGDPENNDLSNLALMTNVAHRKIHTRERRLRENLKD